jgi:hypothetical protein
MADPLSVSAAVLGLISRVTEVAGRLRKSGDSSENEDLWILEELSVYESILRETAEAMLKSLPIIPPSAEEALDCVTKACGPSRLCFSPRHEGAKERILKSIFSHFYALLFCFETL